MRHKPRTGSSKVINAMGEGELRFIFTDNWSVFDRGSSRQSIPTSGASRCAVAVQSFEYAHAAGLPTHFIKQLSPIAILVREFAVPEQEPLSGYTHGRVLPLEWIKRHRVEGSLADRVEAGEIDLAELGFERGIIVTRGMELPRLMLECTTKFESVDRRLTDEQARDLAGLTSEQWVAAQDLVRREDEVTTSKFREAGFRVLDGKDELALTNEGEVVLVDAFGTQDENRIVDAITGEIYSKDLKRNYLKEHHRGWYEALKAAKAEHPNDKSSWPEYPKLPDEFIQLDADRYAEVARRYADTII